MKMRLITTFTALLLCLGVAPTFAQDTPPTDVPTAETAAAPEAAPAPEAAAAATSPERENGDDVASDGNASTAAPKPAIAPAMEEVKQTALAKLSEELLNILIPAFVTLIGLLVTLILNWVRKKFKLNVSDSQISTWSVLAEKAANRGAEWARNKAKDLTDGKTVPGPEILEVAVDWAVEMGKSLKLPEMGREKLIGLIEGHLAVKRADPNDPLPA